MMKITDVLVACDTVEDAYRIVELEEGRYAFVWGNVRSRVGDVLPAELVAEPLSHKGIQVFDSYADAENAYRDCAEALQQSSSRAGDEMLRLLN